MKTLEQEAKQGSVLTFRAVEHPNTFVINLSGKKKKEMRVFQNDSIGESLEEFGEKYDFIMPNLEFKGSMSKRVNSLLVKGYLKEEEFLKTELVFEFDGKRKVYFSKIGIQNNSWIDYVKNHPGEPLFLREICFGKSSLCFGRAYYNMLESL